MEAAKLLVTISADIDGLAKGMATAAKDIKSSFLPAHLGAELIADGIANVAQSLVGVASGAIKGLMEAERASAQTAAAIKSTGGAAGVTVAQVAGLADTLERVTGVQAEVVQGASNMLLTFTNVKNRVGENNDIFNQATKTALDMSVALGGDASQSAMQLGKALNDPVAGVGALARVGVTFTDQQKDQIKAMQGAGDMAGAQKIILAELGKEFGGSAKAAGETFAGSLKKVENGFGALTESIMQGSIPGLQSLATIGAETFYKLSDAINDQGLINGIMALFGPETKAMVLGIGVAVTSAVIPAMIKWAATSGAAAAASLAAWAPFLALAGAIAFAATPIIKYWDDLAFEFGHAFDFVGTKINEFVSWMQKGFNHVANNIVGPVVSYIAGKLAGLWNALPKQARESLEAAGMVFGNLAKEAGKGIHALGMAHVNGAKFVAGAFSESFAGWDGMLKAGMATVKKFTAGVGTDLGKLTDTLNPKLGGLKDGIGGIGKATKQAADDAKKNADEIAKVIGALPAKFKAIDAIASLNIDPTNPIKEKVKALESAIKSLIEHGLAPQDKRVQELVKSYKKYAAALDVAKGDQAAADAIKKRGEAMAGLSAELEEARGKQEVYGSSMNVAAEEARAYEKALETLRKTGLASNDKAMAELIVKWKAAMKASKDFKDHSFDVADVMKDVAENLKKVDARATVYGKSVDVAAEKSRVLESALNRMIEEGVSPASEEIKALKAKLDIYKPSQEAATGAVSAFRTAMGNTSTQVSALMGNLTTLATPLGITIPEAFTDATTKAAAFVDSGFKIGEALMSIGPTTMNAIATFGSLGTTLLGLWPVMTGFAASLWAVVVPAIVGVGAAIFAAVGWVGVIAAAIAGLVLAGMWLAENWTQVSATLGGVWATIANGATTAFGAVASVVRNIWDGVIATIKGSINMMIAAMNFLIRGVNRIKIQVPDWVPGIGGKGWGGMGLAEIPMLAKGGMVSSPTMAMIGEGRSNEAVLPLNAGVFAQLGAGIIDQLPGGGLGGGGGDTYIEIHVQGQNDPEQAARQIVRLLKLKGVTA